MPFPSRRGSAWRAVPAAASRARVFLQPERGGEAADNARRGGESNADSTLLTTTLPFAPGLVDRLEAGIDAADFGCGNGHTLNVMARAFPRSRLTGYDLLPATIAVGQAEARKLGLSNVRLVLQDLAELDLPAAFDLITVFDVIHDLAKPRAVLHAIHAALRPRGTFFMADVRASSYLGSMWGEEKALEYLSDAGFRDVTIRRPDGDLVNSFYICSEPRDGAGRCDAGRAVATAAQARSVSPWEAM